MTPEDVTKYEFHIVRHIYHDDEIEAEVLNGYGAWGWNLVSVYKQCNRREYYFSREIKKDRKPNMKNRFRCWWYHGKRHGKSWDGSRCHICGEHYTRSFKTPKYGWLWLQWKLRTRGR